MIASSDGSIYERAEEVPLNNDFALENAINLLRWWYIQERHKNRIPIMELWIKKGTNRGNPTGNPQETSASFVR